MQSKLTSIPSKKISPIVILAIKCPELAASSKSTKP
jgi:hypothetical protein